MAQSIYKGWEDTLKTLKDAYNSAIGAFRTQKNTIFSTNTKGTKMRGRVIRDEQRIVLSAPEIIIGNVNLGGLLDFDHQSNIIIRGNHVSVEGVGAEGKMTMRAPIISQTAVNPGIDGKEQNVEATSKIVSQAASISIESCDVPTNGAFLEAASATRGSIALNSDHNIELNAQKSRESMIQKLTEKINALDAQLKNENNTLMKQVDDKLKEYQEKRKELEAILDEKEKLKKEDEMALRKDYRDMDELNILIDELSVQLTEDFYNYALLVAELAETARQKQYFTEKKNAINGVSAKDFKEKTTNTAVLINSEKIALTSKDADENLRTNKEAGISLTANDMKVEGVFDNNGSLEKGSQFFVNTRKVEISTAGKTGVERDENGVLKTAEFKNEGEVTINSKNITLESNNKQVAEKKLKVTGLTEEGTITINAQTIGLSNSNVSGMEIGDDGSVKNATYTPKGFINVFSNAVNINAMENKIENGTYKETALASKSMLSVHMENMHLATTDHEGKAVGQMLINSKDINMQSANVDPKTGDFKETAEGSSIKLMAEQVESYALKNTMIMSGEHAELVSPKEVLVQGDETAVIKQGDKNHLSLKDGNAELSGSKNTLKGETTVNVLKSPSITVDNLTTSKAIKSPNITDGIMVDTKNTSGGTAALKSSAKEDELKKGKKTEASKLNEKPGEGIGQDANVSATTAAQIEGLNTDKNK